MEPDYLATATDAIRDRTRRGHSSLEATFQVTEGMSDQVAQAVLDRLIAQRFLDRESADLAQMLIARLGLTDKYRWQHMPLVPDATWQEGRGQ